MRKRLLIAVWILLNLANAQNYEIKVGRNPLLIEESDTTFLCTNQDLPNGYIQRFHKNGHLINKIISENISNTKVSIAHGPNKELFYFGNIESDCDDINYEYWFKSLDGNIKSFKQYSDPALDEPFIWVKGNLLYLGNGDYLKKYQLLDIEYQIVDSIKGPFSSIRLGPNNQIACCTFEQQVIILNEDFDVLYTKPSRSNHILANQSYYYLIDVISSSIIRLDEKLQTIDSLKNVNTNYFSKPFGQQSYIYLKPLLNDSILIIANDRKISIYDTAFNLKREIKDTASRNGAQILLFKNQLLVLRDEHIKSFNLNEQPKYEKNLKLSNIQIDSLVIEVNIGSSENSYYLSAKHHTAVTLSNIGTSVIDSVTITTEWNYHNPINSSMCENKVKKHVVLKDLNLKPSEERIVDLGYIEKTNYGIEYSSTKPQYVDYKHCLSVSVAPDDQIDADHKDNANCRTEMVLVTDLADADLAVFQGVYPNPCMDVIHLPDKELKSYEVFSTAGNLKMVGEISNESINVSNLPKGLYLVKFQTINGGASVVKIEKK